MCLLGGARQGLYIFMPETEGQGLSRVADVVKRRFQVSVNEFQWRRGASDTAMWQGMEVAVLCIGDTSVKKTK